MTGPRLSAGLLSATRAALEVLHRHYPRKFALAMQRTDDGAQYVSEYAAALLACDFDKIPAAARQWVATEKFGPSPAELSAVARALTFADRPAVPAAVPAPDASVFSGAKAFWFERAGADAGYGRLNAQHAIAFQILRRGCLNITEREMDAIHAGEIGFGWMAAHEVPGTAAPDEFFASHGIRHERMGAA